MRRNLSHIIAAAFNEPLLLEPAYARVFFCALGREMGAASLSVPQQQVQFDAPGMLAETDGTWPEVNDRPVFTGW